MQESTPAGTTETFIGLMSGTSLDGVDAVLAEFDVTGALAPRLLSSFFLPYPDSLREELIALHLAANDEIDRAARCASTLADIYAEAVHGLLERSGASSCNVRAIGCHGQTIRHRPEAGYTLQLNNPSRLAELCGIDVVADFRSRDIAAGGQGAPLVPAFHRAVFASPEERRVVANIGGMSNLTDLTPSRPVRGFDCGPGIVLLDAWCRAHTGENYDSGGAWAATGHVIPDLFECLSLHPFFNLVPPKSCGREQFNLAWLHGHLSGRESPNDVQATLSQLTAHAIASSVTTHCSGAAKILACGGGAHNRDLLSRLSSLLPGVTVALTDDYGVPADWVEALAFAWLVQRMLHRLPGNLPEATGAAGPRILGALYPA